MQQVPGIARWWSICPVSELMGIGFADNHSSGPAQLLDNSRIFLWNVFCKNFRARSHAYILDGNKVFDSDRYSVKRATKKTCTLLALCLLRFFVSLVAHNCNEGLNVAVKLIYRIQRLG